MRKNADCFAAVIEAARMGALAVVVAASVVASGLSAIAQGSGTETAAGKPPAAATYSGCVQKAPDSPTTLVISTPTACARLTGKVSPDTLAGHAVVLNGILTPSTASAPASIQVNSVGSVGNSCSDVCSLRPPGTRGLHRPDSAVPGSEGGTPGVTTAPHP